MPAPVAATRHALPEALKVMLVEDQDEVRTVTMKLPGAMGCKVQAFGTGESALQALPGLRGIAIFLSDVALGSGMRGTALPAAVQQARPSIEVLMMSGRCCRWTMTLRPARS